MENNKNLQLDPGFDEVSLDEGFDEIPLKEIKPNKSLRDLSSMDKLGFTGKNISVQDDFIEGAKQGSTFGFSDEIAGGTQAGLDWLYSKLGGKSPTEINKKLKELGFQGDVGPTSSEELYRQGQQEELNKYKEAQERNPVITTLGEVAGGLIVPAGVGGKALKGISQGISKAGIVNPLLNKAATSALAAAPVGALYGAGQSDAKILEGKPGETNKLVKNTLSGAATGSLLGAGVSLVTDLAPIAGKKVANTLDDLIGFSDSDIGRKLTKAYEVGKEGLSFSGKSNEKRIMQEARDTSINVAKVLEKADNTLGKQQASVISQATNDGVLIQPSSGAINAIADAQALLENKNVLGSQATNEVQELLNKFKLGQLTPVEAQRLKITINKNMPPEPGDAQRALIRLQDNLKSNMNTQIKGLPEINQQITQFKAAGPETLIAKGRPEEFRAGYMSDKVSPETNMFDALDKIVKDAGKPGVSGESATQQLNIFTESLKKFDDTNPGVLEKLGINPGNIQKQILEQSDIVNIRRAIVGHDPHGGTLKQLLGIITPTGVAYRAANVVGRGARNFSEMGRKIYSYPTDKIKEIADKLGMDPSTAKYGDALRDAAEKNDITKRNAIIFSMMQSPNLRGLLFNASDLEQEK